jgi:hypothetical protein
VGVTRYDFGTVQRVERTPQGGLRVPAAVTRTGVLTYQRADGSVTREWRPADEVFATDSLATLRGAPVTDLHPQQLVTTDTWKELAVGHVGDAPRREGDLLVADLVVQDAAECARIEARERVEVSCGYECDVEPTPGVTPEGERYDAVQRRVKYNHVGLGPSGWGRAGPRVALRLDGAAQVTADESAREMPMKLKIKVAGKEYRADSPEEMAAAQGAVDDVEKKDADLAGELDKVSKALTEALTQVATLKAQMAAQSATAPAPTDAPPADEAAMEAALDAREALRADALLVLGESDDTRKAVRGKRAREVHELVVKSALPETKLDGLPDATVAGMYTAVVAGRKRATESLGAVNAATNGAPAGDAGARTDAADDSDPAAKAKARLGNMWKRPASGAAVKGA